MDRQFAAVSATPATEIPLSAAHLRSPEGELTEPVGPGGPVPPLPSGVDPQQLDWSRFQSAAEPQRLEELEPEAIIELEGLSLRGRSRQIRLPRLLPRAWVESGMWGTDEITLQCDTLWIDTDFERLVLVWRGGWPLRYPDAREIRRLVVSLEDPAAERTLEEVLAAVPHGKVEQAVEEMDLRGERPPPGEPNEVEVARYEALRYAAEPTLSLERYARISAELAEQDVPRQDVLERHELDEDSWLVEERGWLERMGKAAMGGDGTLAIEFGELFVAAQEELAGPEEPRSLADFAAIKVALEHTYEPQKTMAEHEIRLAEWLRLERHWTRRADSDPAVAQERDELMARQRARYQAAAEGGVAPAGEP